MSSGCRRVSEISIVTRQLVAGFTLAATLAFAYQTQAQEFMSAEGAYRVSDSLDSAFKIRHAAWQPPQGTIPEVVVEGQGNQQNYNFAPSQSFYGVYPDGSIDWSSDLITSDSELVGPYAQPVWTTQRPFSTTRVYVLPPGQMQVEQW